MIRPRVAHWPFHVLNVGVCLAAIGVGGSLGQHTSTLYRLWWGANWPGMKATALKLGLLGGLIAGAAWCALINAVAIRRLRRGAPASPGLIVWGAFAGHAAALLSAGVVLGGLMIEEGRWNTPGALAALVASAVVGLTLGAIAGLLAWAAAALARRDRAGGPVDGEGT